MGWTTDLWCCISFSRETFDRPEQVEDSLGEVRRGIRLAENRLRGLAFVTDLRGVYACEGDGCDVVSCVTQDLDETLERLSELRHEECMLMLLRDNWGACHDSDGRPIRPPEGFDCETAFIDGDYIGIGGEEVCGDEQ